MNYKKFQGQSFMKELELPTVKGWNRLEGRPRTKEFDKTLRAEIRDPLWMLTRQWQMGEFIANDAGSPIFAKVRVTNTKIDRYQVKANTPQTYDETIPLETRVERESPRMNLDLSLQIGRYWLRLLDREFSNGNISSNYRQDFIDKYFVELSQRDESTGHIYAHIYAHQEVWQMFAATAGRSMDGGALYEDILGGENILDGMPIDLADIPKIHSLEQQLTSWIRRQYSLPEAAEDSAWAPSYLEYQFACSAPDYDGEGQIVLTADEYHQGHLDWYSFDIHPDLDEIEQPENEPVQRADNFRTSDFIPVIIEFGGMPNVRWWEFEDRKTHFGDIDAHTTDIARLLLIEFGLIYANDWFLLPFKFPVGSLAKVEGLAVTNVFGERIWIAAAGSGEQDDWQRWAMYNLNTRGTDGAADLSIFIPPAVDRLQESESVEQVHLIRDEMANMVWGVESRVVLPNGESKDGYEVATELVNYLMSFLPPPEAGEPEDSSDAKIRYVLMTSVPENWIPFMPVRMPQGDNREIQLQRAAMLRTLSGSIGKPKIRPRTGILRYNPDGSYFIHEEEIPRAGAQVNCKFQRARWHNGKVCVWLGRRKRTGRGQGSSGLAFDQIKSKGNEL